MGAAVSGWPQVPGGDDFTDTMNHLAPRAETYTAVAAIQHFVA